ncbi:MAG: HAMP domain-containing protein [Lachnospiraceae bacterium]|jgi:methyl-accepting chemotaxis protein|nr:HAMP domain-containing protein [Lachnospiraceae bacterium]
MNLASMRIQKRLTTSFLIVATLLSTAGIIAAIASFVMGRQYADALVNYGFAQGDVGRMMTHFADLRSCTRAIIGYDDPEIVDEVYKNYNEMRAQFDTEMAAVGEGLVTDEAIKTFAQLETAVDKYFEVEARVQEMGASGDDEQGAQAQEIAYTEMADSYKEAYCYMESIMETKTNKGAELSKLLEFVVYAVVAINVVLVVLGVVIAMNLGVKVANGIAKPLIALSDRFDRFSKGDLESEFPVYDRPDEVGDMLKSGKEMSRVLCGVIQDLKQALTGLAAGDWTVTSQYPEMFIGDLTAIAMGMDNTINQMNETLHNMRDVSEQVSVGASGLAEAAQSLAEGATDQAGAVEELQATIANISEAVGHTAQKTKESYDQAQEYSEKADVSRGEMEKLMEVMGRINETSQQIGNIISEIEDIASQTNLLSLNASIEAARAGEAGKGFAVVADQIGKLADQSGKSAVDTRRLIEGILQEIEDGNNVAGHAAGAIAEVVEGVNHIAGTVSGLAQISSEQAESMGQVEIGINQISEIVQSNSAAAEELSATSQEMLAQAETMSNLEKQFKLKD